MVPPRLPGARVQSGVRPFSPYRDLGAVTALVSAAFGERLDPTGRAVLTEMRRLARWGPLLWWFYGFSWDEAGGMAGFVWVEDGRVVGNVSLRRAPGWGGFLIGNVAVHPDWQRRGIAAALMEAALDEISARGGHWVGLEVEADNEIARRLYERLEFGEVGRTLHMVRPAGLSWSGEPPRHPALRRGRGRDGMALVRLMNAIVPEMQRPLLEMRAEDYQPGWRRTFDQWLEGRRETWRVVEEEGGGILGAARALWERGKRLDRLEVLLSPEGGDRYVDLLVRSGMASLRVPKRAVEIVLPQRLVEPLAAALEAVGFQELRVLVQMRLVLARRLPLRVAHSSF